MNNKTLIYIVVGVLVLGAAYFLFFNNSTSTPEDTAMEEESTMMEDAKTVVLDAQNDSGETGTAVLTEENGETTVVVTLDGAPTGSDHPAHIHMGACPEPGEVAYPLTNVVNGTSETVLPVTLAELESQMPLAINVHQSTAEISTYVACGDFQ